MSVVNLNRLVSLPKLDLGRHHDAPENTAETKTTQARDEYILASVNLAKKTHVFEPFKNIGKALRFLVCQDSNWPNCGVPYRKPAPSRANTILGPGSC